MVKDKAVHKTAPEQVEREADCILETLADNPSLKKLKRAMIQTILLYYGVEQKQIVKKTFVELKELYEKVKADNPPKEGQKKWTSADEVQLTELMNDKVAIHKIERLISITKERGEAGVLEMIRGSLLSKSKLSGSLSGNRNASSSSSTGLTSNNNNSQPTPPTTCQV